MATLSANETLVDLYVERAIDLLRLEVGTRNKVFRILADLEGELVGQLAKVDPTGVPSVSGQRKRLEKLLVSVQSAIRASYRSTSSLMTAEIREIIDQEAVWTGRAINTAIDFEFVTGGLTRAGLETLASDALIQGAASKDWWGRQAAGLADRFADEMRRGVALGESNADLIARLRGKTGQPGIMAVSRTSAERLVRASVQAAANVGREEMYAKNDDLIASLQWHATLDTRTSTWCITRDGHHYSNTPEHFSKDGGPKWLEGPGKLHWGALVEGTRIKTARGQIPIEQVQIGDSVLTHTGKWSTVSAKRAKRLESGVVRVVHTESGRVLRATDDHPVRLANGAWVFVGALETGDYLLCDSESVPEISVIDGVVHSEAENRPAGGDNARIAIKRAFQLVAPDVDFDSEPERGYREIEDRCSRVVLWNPSIIERDQSAEHHLFAMADALQKVGRNALGDLLALRVADLPAPHSFRRAFVEPRSRLGFERLGDNIRALGRIVAGHALRLGRIFGMRLFGSAPSPMRFASRGDSVPTVEIETGLFSFGANGDGVPPRVAGKDSVRQVVGALDTAQGFSGPNVFARNQVGEDGGSGWVCHEQIVALEMQTVNINVYDLEVCGPSSYVANGIVVSNCRSTSVPVLKTWRELGIDEDEVPETTRASMDGQVPAKQSFEDWLKKQGAARQDTVLGATVADLWRRGKIGFRDLLDQSGRPLTTEQLRAKAARR